ncbi:MAG TPA: nuclear transport factor 2 family protein, partial [Novosphingobium sp.]|nr:nuclear transport factor 2 family protein [Novosphingobium sp.]
MAFDAELERRIREQLDRDEILRVLMRYARGLDRLDNELARSCYWDDAIEDHGSYVGRPDDFIAWADGTTLAFRSTQHGILNHSCDLQGNDAYCETYFLFTSVSERAPHLMSTGRYVDHFQKRQGASGPEWRIATRVCFVEAKYGLDDYVFPRLAPPAYTPE